MGAAAGRGLNRGLRPQPDLRSVVDGGHLLFFVAFPGGRGEVVQPFDLLGAQLEGRQRSHRPDVHRRAGSKSEEALTLLGSWAATLHEAEAADATPTPQVGA